jgi:PAS domain S-box-containing protein
MTVRRHRSDFWSRLVTARGQDADLALRMFFAGILDVAEDGIITIDDRQDVVLFNRGAEKIFGYMRADVLGKHLEMLLPQRFAAGHRDQVDEFARSSVVSRNMGERREVYGRRKSGEEFPADVSISKMLVDGRKYFTAIVRDVTQRRQAEDAIRRLNQELEQRVVERTAALTEANRQLLRKSEENETFVYSVSHDLRSPLVNLEGFSQELRTVSAGLVKVLADPTISAPVRERVSHLLNRDMAESLDYIETAVARLSRIIDALLRLSRAGRVEYRPQVVDLNDVLRKIIGALHGTIQERRAEVVVAALPTAWGDPVALEQVFANLVGNALNYLAPDRRGRVDVGALESSAGERTYFVKDNGLGIPAGYLPQLFQAFRRLHPDVTGGEGMGLAIVRRIIERHGGRIWAESESGKGTTFYVTLPQQDHDARNDSEGMTHDSGAHGDSARRR